MSEPSRGSRGKGGFVRVWMTKMRGKEPEPVGAQDVLRQEREEILGASRASEREGGFLGLAISGGGIRSATFNLGVLQALCERRVLSRVDYLSTVSGGGYIGSWLSALVRRKGSIEAVELELDPREQAKRGGAEPDAVRFLRRFSNYLTPRTGLLSSDTLSGVATYVRNLLLMQSMIVGVFVLALVLPRLIPLLAQCSALQSPMLCILALFVAALFINLNLAHQLIEARPQKPFFARQRYVVSLIVVPLVLAAWLVSVLLLPSGEARPDPLPGPIGALARMLVDSDANVYALAKFIETTLVFGLVWIVAWLLVELVVVRRLARHVVTGYRRSPVVLVWLFVSLLVGVGLLCLVRETLNYWQGEGALIWHWTVFGVPILLSVFGLASILLIGLVGREFAEEEREWWSRLGAWLIAFAVGWLALCAASIYGPFAVILAQDWIRGLSLAWVASTVGGVMLGKSRATGGPGANRWLNIATEIAPYVFVAGLLIALSFAIHVGLLEWFDDDSSGSAVHAAAERLAASNPAFAVYADLLNAIRDSSPPSWGAPLLLLALVALLVWRLDINLFSFHMFYRNRLVRCYLGASNAQRNPHPFTGFDPGDNLKLTNLLSRPFHIVNTAINLTKVNNLAWQERKAASFVFTRKFCGYELPETGSSEPAMKGYQPTADYLRDKGWLTLGQALTISGAAVSPNQGYHSSKAVAFLLAVFNVRLGWWMQNPAKQGAWSTPGPRLGIRYLLSEVFGLADENTEFVYLSDGGHFENLGIYELVRRKCRFIISIDAGMDPKFGFEDLGNAVRKCQVDFGVRIDIDTKASIPVPGTGKSLYHCGVGRIRYEGADPEAVSGYLLYIKPSLTGNEPIDIMQYASVHPDFPHQSTTDQWFDESQLEAYRKLGHYIATTVLEKPATEPPHPPHLLDLFVDLSRRWYRPSANVEAHFTKHAERLMHMQDTIRSENSLSFLDSQIFPEWDYLMRGGQQQVSASLWLPLDPDELRAGFYYCLNLLELMQDVYLDLNLDEEWQHPDNRGWMNLFKHFSWAGMVRATYAVVRSNFGARFQRFCAVRLELPDGKVEIAKAVERDVGLGPALKAWTGQRLHDGDANFVELGLIYAFENPPAPAGPAQAPKFDKLHRIELAVPGIHRGRDNANSSSPSELRFPVGVALTLRDTIVLFRIQDHLRSMGLGRLALRALLDKGFVKLKLEDDSLDAKRIKDLFDSVKGMR